MPKFRLQLCHRQCQCCLPWWVRGDILLRAGELPAWSGVVTPTHPSGSRGCPEPAELLQMCCWSFKRGSGGQGHVPAVPDLSVTADHQLHRGDFTCHPALGPVVSMCHVLHVLVSLAVSCSCFSSRCHPSKSAPRSRNHLKQLPPDVAQAPLPRNRLLHPGVCPGR